MGYAEKWSTQMVLGKKNPQMVLGKLVPGNMSFKNCSPSKGCLKIWTTFFIFIDWFHYTHKNMFDGHVLTILHAPYCRTLKESRKDYCWVLGFHRFVTSQHSTHTHTHTHTHHARCSMLDAHPMIFCFWIFWGLFFRGFNSSGTIFPGDHFILDQFFGDHIFPGTISPGTIFPRANFSGTNFSRGPLFGDHFSLDQFSGDQFFPGSIFRGPVFSGDQFSPGTTFPLAIFP